MRLLIILLTLMIYNNALCKELEFTYSILNAHIWARSDNFSHTIDNNGILMYNPWYTVRYYNISMSIGKDSIGETVYGIYYYNKFKSFNYIIGGYTCDAKTWNASSNYNNLCDTFNFNPVIGLVKSFKLQDKTYLNLVLTPAIIQLNIGVKF